MAQYHGDFEFELEARRASENLLHESEAYDSGSTLRQEQKTSRHEQRAIEKETPTVKRGPRRRFAWLPTLSVNSYTRWLYEILCSLIAVIALLAIVITLSTHEGRPIPDWPFRISINALISVFAVILKGALMIPVAEAISQLKWIWYSEPHELSDLTKFDLASRGPGGAVQLVYIQRGLHLASLGAIITMLVIAVDPFIQQVIKYHPCPQSMFNTQASIARTNNYTAHGIHTGAGTTSLDVPMQAAIYKGVYDSYSPVSLQCPTGNCTYPDYNTVGICSDCIDVTHTVTRACNASRTSGNETSCTWTLPSGWSLANFDSSTTMIVVPGPGYSYVLDGNYLSTSEILTFTGTQGYDSVHDNSEVVAVQCKLSPCVRTYRANVTNNIPSDVLLASQLMEPHNWTTFLQPYQRFTSLTMPCLINGNYFDATAFTKRPPDNETDWLVVVGLLPNDQIAYVPLECYFWFDEGSVFSLVQYLPYFLNGSVIDMIEAGIVSYDAPWAGQVLYNDRNPTYQSISAFWAALADSMTVQVRLNGDASNSKNTVGMVINIETCVSVRWPWIAFPATLIAFMFLFLAATMVQSARHKNRHIWKSSPLALLFHGLDDETRERQLLVNEIREMDRSAKELRVQIQHTEAGWMFVHQDE